MASLSSNKRSNHRSGSEVIPRRIITLISLNHDVLAAVFNNLSRKEALGLMGTCRTLFNIGLPRLFQHPYRVNTKTLKSFYTFLLLASPSSFLSLRHLRIPSLSQPPGLPIDQVILLINLLSKATNLLTLTLLDYTVYNYRTFYSAIPHLKQLLSFTTGNNMSRETLEKLRSPLVQLVLKTSVNFDPIKTCAHFSDTLQEIALVSPRIQSVDIQYPHVIRVVLDHYNLPFLSVLVPVFPHLKKLSISTGDAENVYITCREKNVKFQEEVRQWSSVVSLVTDIGGVLGLALQHEIASLYLITAVYANQHIDLLREALLPLRLTCFELTYEPGEDSIQLQRAIEPTFDTLRRLDLKLDLRSWKGHYRAVAVSLSLQRRDTPF